MATYDKTYSNSIKINPATPNIRGLTTNYSNDGKTDLSGTGLGDIYGLDYDRDKIESIFNNATDKKYALMQKENQIAQNQYANNQFANQQSAIESLRAQRNEQIASGMARGLNAAQEQGTILGVQQEGAAGALELANKQQLAADQIAAEYAENVIKALQEANSVKQAMASLSGQLYEADMLGYTGELSAAAQMDANASDRYGYDKGYEGTIYTADKNYEGTKYNANKNYEGTVYNANMNLEGTKYTANKNLEGTKYNADKNYAAAQVQAAATRAAAAISASAGGSTRETTTALEEAVRQAKKDNPNLTGNELVNTVQSILRANSTTSANYAGMDQGQLWNDIDQYVVNKGYKDQTKADWEKTQPKGTTTTKKTTTTSTKSNPYTSELAIDDRIAY